MGIFLLMERCSAARHIRYTDMHIIPEKKTQTPTSHYVNFKAYFTKKGYQSRQQFSNKSNSPLYHDTVFTRRYYKMYVEELLDTSIRCAPTALGDSSLWTGTPNFGLRTPNFIILHHTAQPSAAYTLHFFARPDTEVSAHYLIAKDGTIYPIVQDYLRSWHAGVSKWGNCTNMNSVSLGIELDNDGEEPFPKAQITSLLALLTELTEKYNIPPANVIGHADIAPGRKKDPNHLFPWKTLAEQGFGIWYEDNPAVRKAPKYFDPLSALRVIGYDVSSPYAAFISFRRHFMGSVALDKTLSAQELRILYLIYKQCMSDDASASETKK